MPTKQKQLIVYDLINSNELLKALSINYFRFVFSQLRLLSPMPSLKKLCKMAIRILLIKYILYLLFNN